MPLKKKEAPEQTSSGWRSKCRQRFSVVSSLSTVVPNSVYPSTAPSTAEEAHAATPAHQR